MALRVEKTACAAGVIALCLAPAVFAQKEFRLEARHDHWRKYCSGVLRIDANGVSYEGSAPKKKEKDRHVWRWPYRDIQQLMVAPGVVRVLTYKDVTWKLGADRELEFRLSPAAPVSEIYAFLKDRLDQRLVAGLADDNVKALWEIPAKHLGRIRGSEGVLSVAEDRIAYRTALKGGSRTWRYADIEDISSSGPFQLTITTFERAKSHYGNYRGFNFQLKEALDERRYNDLWWRLNRFRGLQTLTSIREKGTNQ